MQVLQGGSLLAAATEEGMLFVVNTDAQLPEGLHPDQLGPKPLALWEAHANAIFHLTWMQACLSPWQPVSIVLGPPPSA